MSSIPNNQLLYCSLQPSQTPKPLALPRSYQQLSKLQQLELLKQNALKEYCNENKPLANFKQNSNCSMETTEELCSEKVYQSSDCLKEFSNLNYDNQESQSKSIKEPSKRKNMLKQRLQEYLIHQNTQKTNIQTRNYGKKITKMYKKLRIVKNQMKNKNAIMNQQNSQNQKNIGALVDDLNQMVRNQLNQADCPLISENCGSLSGQNKMQKRINQFEISELEENGSESEEYQSQSKIDQEYQEQLELEAKLNKLSSSLEYIQNLLNHVQNNVEDLSKYE